MRRREVVGLVGGVAALPLVARAQSSGWVLRIGAANVQPRTAPQGVPSCGGWPSWGIGRGRARRRLPGVST